MKKVILLILTIFILCGCSANVNININEDNIEETVEIISLTENGYTKEQNYNSFRKYIPIYADTIVVDTEPDEPVSGIKYYNRTEKEYGNGYLFTYNNTFKLNDYVNSQTVKNGFKSSSIIFNDKEEYIELSTSKGELLYYNIYPYLTEVKVNITTSYDVLENNADSVNGNTYTWTFRPTTNKSIYLKLSNPKKDTSKPNGNNTNEQTEKSEKKGLSKIMNEHPIIVAICAIALFLIFVIIFSKLSKH